MVGAVQGAHVSATGTGAGAATASASADPKTLARQILGETGGHGMKYDRLGQIEARLDSIQRSDPKLAADVRREIMASPSLSAVDKGTLQRNAPGRTIDIGGGKTVRSTEDGMDLDRWINMQRRQGTPEYAQLVKVAGSDDNAAIKTLMQEAVARGISVDQLATARLNEASGAGSGVDSELIKDVTQMALDIIGIFDPTGISDGANALISLGRGDWVGAGLSAISIVPFVGDLAKAGKLGKWASTMTKAIEAAASNPAARQALEPMFKKLQSALHAIPETVWKNMPDSMRSTLEGMKGKLDDLLGKADIPNRPTVVDGRPQYYVDGAGTKGNWRKDINIKLQPDADYHVNGYKFSTDAQGRVKSVEGELTLAKAERNGYQQRVAGGKTDRLEDDQGGHLIASIFNGPGEAINLKAMNGSLNNKEFKNLETTLADALKAGKKVDVKIDVVHSGDSLRPDKFMVTYVIDGAPKRATFTNQAGG